MRRRHSAFAVFALLFLCTNASAANGNGSLAPGQSTPINSTLPTITGTATVGKTLTANLGTWNGPSPSYSYQWLRCGTTGALCSPILTAKAQTYLVASADLGSTLRVTVMATNKNGSTLATSLQTSIISSPSTPTTTTSTTTTTTTTPSTTTSTSTTTTSTNTTTTATTTTTPTTTTTSTATLSVDGTWYLPTSAWNTPVPATAPVHPSSTSMISAMQNVYCTGSGCIAPTDFYSTPSVWIARNSTPLVTVQINYPNGCNSSRVQIPIPSGAVPSHSGDPEPVMTVLQADTGEEWDFFKVTPPGVTPVSYNNCAANSLWQTVVAAHHSPGWTGLGSGTSTRASGTLLGTGTIRPRDWQQPAGSTWDHALAFAYPGTNPNHVYPAISSDGQCGSSTSCVPEGARFQLDPSVNCATWPSLASEFQRQMCRTLQRYGMIVVDSGKGLVAENSVSAQSTSSSADGPHSGQIAPWNLAPYAQYLPQDLVAKLRVIDWSRWTG
jgi:hypothetical protein